MNTLIEVSDIFQHIISFNDSIDYANLMLVNKNVSSMVRNSIGYSPYLFINMCSTGDLNQVKLLYAYSLENKNLNYHILYHAISECVMSDHMNVYDWFYSDDLKEKIYGHAENQAFQILCIRGNLAKAKEVYCEERIDSFALECILYELENSQKYPEMVEWINNIFAERTY